nr:tRNA lysidine(34) synthetase TilS [Paenibacillus terrigena]
MRMTKIYALAGQVEQVVREHQLWTPGSTIVVAVSGGPDSVALLHVLHMLAAPERHHLQLIVAHANHGFRQESVAEAEIVKRIASDLELPCEVAHLEIPEYIERTGMNSQAAAREQRYAFLHATATKYGASHIALAHHADDQAETVMMRLIRGSGAAGLAGMAISRTEKNVELIRPFLRIYKTDLMDCCEDSGLQYVTDESNNSRKYVRNQIRLDVMPFLGQYNEQIVKALNRTADLLRADSDYLEQEASEQLAANLKRTKGGYQLARTDLTNTHVALQRRFIKLILSYLAQKTDTESDSFDYEKIEAIRLGILQTQPTTWMLDISERIQCVRSYDQIDFIHRLDSQGPVAYEYRIERGHGEQWISDHSGLLRWNEISYDSDLSEVRPKHRCIAFFDADCVHFPLIVRNRRPGDRMRILGLNGSKKVQDIFIDEKIAPVLRDAWPVITDCTGQILWIPGVRRSAHATVEEQTTRLVRLELCRYEG